MEEKRKKERRETRVKVIGFGALAVCYLAMALWNCWDKRAGLGIFYLEEAVGVLCSPEEHIRLWAKSGGGTACVWKGEARRLPTELRKLPLLRFSGRAPEETEVIGYLEIETELPAGWKLREEGAAPRRGLREAAERLVCPHCGGRAHHTVGGKEFCSLCLEEMRRE